MTKACCPTPLRRSGSTSARLTALTSSTKPGVLVLPFPVSRFPLCPLLALPQENFAGTTSGDFDRTDGSLGASWSNIADGGVWISSQVGSEAGAGLAGDIRTTEAYPSDQYSEVEVTWTRLTGDQWIGPAVRAKYGGQRAYPGLYFWNSGSPDLMLSKRNARGWTQLGNTFSPGPLVGWHLNVGTAGRTICEEL